MEVCVRLILAIVLGLTSVSFGAGGKWIVPESIAQQRPAATSKPAGADPLVNTWICYRASMDLDAVPSWASMRIAADSKYWLWINGELAVFDGSLKRGPTRVDGYVDVVDVGPYLKKGKNSIAILAWYFGKEGFSHISSGMPGLFVESDMLPIKSDAGWRAMVHPAFGKTGGQQPNFRLAESNVRFDGAKEIAGWTSSEFDDSKWPAAKEIGEPPCAPWGKLVQRPIPMFSFSRLKDYENAKDLPGEGGAKPIVAKLPYDAQVTVYLKIDAPKAGETIDLRTDSYITGEATVRSEYVTREGVQEFESPAWMSGHEVHYAIPAGIKVLSLQYRESGYDTKMIGEFNCDDDFYDKLWTKAARTLYVNMRDTYFDCPDRERAQWWGDIVNDLGEAFYSLDKNSSLLARKGFCEIAAWQRKDGTIYSPIPAGNWDKELPPQMLATVGWYGAWTYYLYSGDDATIRDFYPAVKKYLAVWKLGDDGLVMHRAGEWDWEDWGTNIDAPILDNAWFYLALKSASAMAKVAGADSDIAGYQKQMDSIQANFNKAFWAGSEYRSKDYKGDTDDRANGMAVLCGFAPREYFPALQKVLMEHRNCSPYMERFVSEAQFTMGDINGAMTRMKERYGPMVADKLTTLWEQFNRNEGTYNHGWSGGPLILLSKYVAGIAPTSPGYDTYEIRPNLGTLKQVSAKVMTIKGIVRVSIKRGEKRITMKGICPPRSHAKIFAPVTDMPVESSSFNGKTTTHSGGSEVVYEVGPGSWEIVLTGK